MNTYAQCNACKHQWVLVGSYFSLNACPNCKKDAGFSLEVGSKPSWFVDKKEAK